MPPVRSPAEPSSESTHKSCRTAGVLPGADQPIASFSQIGKLSSPVPDVVASSPLDADLIEQRGGEDFPAIDTGSGDLLGITHDEN